MNLEQELLAKTKGEARFDPISQQVYSVDASIFEIPPLGVFYPQSSEDIITAIHLANRYNISLTPRGAGTGITGGCLGSGLIIDTSKYMDRILEIDLKQKRARCQPGTILDALQDQLFAHDLRFGPDTSTSNRATLGGMVANNASGAHSLRYGMTMDHIHKVKMVLSSGHEVEFSPLLEKEWLAKTALTSQEGHIYRRLDQLIHTHGSDIALHFPKIKRRASGYNLNALIEPWPRNLAKLIAGSEGSLGIITEIELRLCPKPLSEGLALLSYPSLYEAACAIPSLLALHPLAIELIDHQIITLGRLSPSLRGKLDWLQGTPQALLVVEGDRQLLESLKNLQAVIINDPQTIHHVWDLRKSGVGVLMSRRSYSKAVAFLEDLAVPPEKLPDFLDELRDFLKRYECEAGIYGHAGEGCIHVRPFIDLRTQLPKMIEMMQEACDLVIKYGGTLSGEHGDGLIRSWLNPKLFHPRIYEAFLSVKEAFDPDHRINPGKIVQGAIPTAQTLRSFPQTEPPTLFRFDSEGGLAFAADMCNGNGLCKNRTGAMCPSFQAYHDEYHSTRARAQALRSVMNGRLPKEAFTSKELFDVLDYCLECKACKTQCPSQVNMAKMKAEFLFHYHEKHGTSLRTSLFSHISELAKIGSFFAPWSNWLPKKWILQAIGITPKRSLPAYSRKRFSSWARHHQNKKEKRVVLLSDTYVEYHFPHIGISAWRLLNALDYAVIVPPYRCCGRPLISKGFLLQAKKRASSLIESLLPYAQAQIPIIGLEPSCILTLKDDYPDLITSQEAQQVANCCATLEEFLLPQIDQLPLQITSPLDLHLHVHCHQKALLGTQTALQLLQKLPSTQAHLIESTCCGLAGSFGYEKEHYEMSMAIAERQLFPAIRALPDTAQIIANGLSCRSQIDHGCQRQPLHVAELLASLLKS